MTLLRSALLLSIVALLVACGGGSEKTDPNVDAASVLSKSAAAIKDVSAFHFKLNHENGGTPIPLGLQLVSAEGDVVVPDKLAADVKAKAASLTASVKVIGIGDKTWITNPFSRKWQELPGTTLQDIADPAALVVTLVDSLQNVELKGTDDVDGVSCYHLVGTLDSGVLKVAVPNAEPGHEVHADLWVAAGDSLPRKARLAGPLSPDEADNIVREVDFSRFNSKIDIQPPSE